MKISKKTIQINGELHKVLKQVCNERGIKLNQWCEVSLGNAVAELVDATTPWRGPVGKQKKQKSI